MKPKKTWGREVAFCGLLIWAAITYRLFFALEHSEVGAYETIYGSVTGVVWIAASAVFGFTGVRDSLNKKLEPRHDLDYD